MIGLERNQLFSAPHIILAPGIAITLTVLGLQPPRRRPARRARSAAEPMTDTAAARTIHPARPPRAVARRDDDRGDRPGRRPPPEARARRAAAARGARPADVVLHPRRGRPGRRRHRLPRRPRRDHGPRRRVGLRQERDQPVDHAPRRQARAASRPARSCSTATDLLKLSTDEMRKIRGDRISMIFQQPTSSLNPVCEVGEQIAEVLRIHRGMKGKVAEARALELLRMVGIPDPQRRLKAFPHEMSGGMAQRVMIAMALACEPELLIADEPTTALDVTIQAQILDLMRNLRDETGTAIVLITHDLGVVAEMCDRVAVMYAGEIVEQTDVDDAVPRAAPPVHPGPDRLDPGRRRAQGRAGGHPGQRPEPDRPADGCRFAPRCVARVEEDIDAGARASPGAAAGQARPRRPVLALPRRTRRPPALAGPQRPGRGRVTGPLVTDVSGVGRPAGDRAHGRRPRPATGRWSRSATSSSTSRSAAGSCSGRSAMVQAVDGVELRDPARRDARAGRRVGLRQDDRRAAASCASSSRPPGRSCSTATSSPTLKGAALKPYRRRMQIIFQDPYAQPRPAHADRRQHRRGPAHPRPRRRPPSGARRSAR